MPNNFIRCPNCSVSWNSSTDYTSPANAKLDAQWWREEHLSGKCVAFPAPVANAMRSELAPPQFSFALFRNDDEFLEPDEQLSILVVDKAVWDAEKRFDSDDPFQDISDQFALTGITECEYEPGSGTTFPQAMARLHADPRLFHDPTLATHDFTQGTTT